MRTQINEKPHQKEPKLMTELVNGDANDAEPPFNGEQNQEGTAANGQSNEESR